jgi:hypothetical protein
MGIGKRISFAIAAALASWAPLAAALDRDGAVDAAKRQLKSKCNSYTPCTFSAKPEGDKWYVRAEFTRRSSLEERAAPYPGGHAILIFDQSGKLVGRVEGK